MNVSAAGRCWIGSCEATYVHNRNRLLTGRTEVLDHVLDQHGALGDLALCEESVLCAAQERVGVEAHTSDNLDAIAGDKLDALLAVGRHAGRCVVKSVGNSVVVVSGVIARRVEETAATG